MKACLVVVCLGMAVADVSRSHKPPLPHKERYGTFLRERPILESSPLWTEITFFLGTFAFKSQDSQCENTFGYGKYEQRNDTLILTDVHSLMAFDCGSSHLENLIIPEKRFLVRPHGPNSFRLLPIEKKQNRHEEWIIMHRYGARS